MHKTSYLLIFIFAFTLSVYAGGFPGQPPRITPCDEVLMFMCKVYEQHSPRYSPRSVVPSQQSATTSRPPIVPQLLTVSSRAQQPQVKPLPGTPKTRD